MNPTHESTSCSVAACAEIIGAKWTALLVHDLSEGARRFTELEHSLPGISPRTLSERLRVLEGEAIVVRRCYAEAPPRVEYELEGQGLLPIIDECEFGHSWLTMKARTERGSSPSFTNGHFAVSTPSGEYSREALVRRWMFDLRGRSRRGPSASFSPA
jgi:DNA-binding HxlR family transcriptional regulator